MSHSRVHDSDSVAQLLELVWKPAKARAAQEAGDLAALAQAEGENGPIRPSDWRHYAEKVRQQLAFTLGAWDS